MDSTIFNRAGLFGSIAAGFVILIIGLPDSFNFSGDAILVSFSALGSLIIFGTLLSNGREVNIISPAAEPQQSAALQRLPASQNTGQVVSITDYRYLYQQYQASQQQIVLMDRELFINQSEHEICQREKLAMQAQLDVYEKILNKGVDNDEAD